MEKSTNMRRPRKKRKQNYRYIVCFLLIGIADKQHKKHSWLYSKLTSAITKAKLYENIHGSELNTLH